MEHRQHPTRAATSNHLADGRAVSLQSRAIDDGHFDQAPIQNSARPLAKVRAKYDDLTAQALDLFEPGEEIVAFWTAAEFYAGWYSPLETLEAIEVPRAADPDGWRLLSTADLTRGWALAQPQELAEWAHVRWPWDQGNARGHRYATSDTPGDTTRHSIVVPNSDVNSDILRPLVLYLSESSRASFAPPSPRESRRLERNYAEANEQHDEYRRYLLGAHSYAARSAEAD
ncbi:hypothetical protein J2Y46_000963 [Microbacterium sp. BE35]|uniref:hypothetical protein n=1 Tax=Microbacterium sp. BE35 TaxID=2817773 RepID=UPI002858B8C5|nr:hypothetical protein [Microbacterium sp. BE35]MDR7188147.1 hypothetical protein [Microbacterium sp. BE35]